MYRYYIVMPRTDKVTKMKTSNVAIMSKPHAHLHTIYKTPAKLQKDLDKTVGEVAFPKYTLIVYEMPTKVTS